MKPRLVTPLRAATPARCCAGLARCLAAFLAMSCLTAVPAVARSEPEWPSDGLGVEIQGDDRIVVAGPVRCSLCQSDGIYVARFRSSGKRDLSFGGGDGLVVVPAPSRFPNLTGLALASDGRILVAANSLGPSAFLGPGQFVLARLTAAGELDRTFGSGGLQTVSFDLFRGGSGLGFRGSGNGLAVSADGAVLAAGSAPDPDGEKFAVTRFLPGGSLDPTFGSGGIASLRVDPDAIAERAYAVALRPDGRVVIAGGRATGPTSGPNDHGAFEAAQLLPDGSPDPTFSTDGRVVAASIIDSSSLLIGAQAVSLTADGGMILTGSRAYGYKPCSNFTLVRLGADGELDASYGQAGVVQTPTDCEGGSDATLTAGGQLIATGSQREGAGNSLTPEGENVFARYTTTGLLDGSFGAGGLAQFPVEKLDSGASTLALDSEQRIIAAGYVDSDFCTFGIGTKPFGCDALTLMRLRPDGTLDPSFGEAGILTDPVICKKATAPPCVLERRKFKRLIRRGLPDSAKLDGRGIRMRIACKRAINERCRFRLKVPPQPRGSKVEVGARQVSPGRRRWVTLRVTKPEARALASKRRFDVQAKARTKQQKPVTVRKSIKLATN